jgi:hypothetical protein
MELGSTDAAALRLITLSREAGSPPSPHGSEEGSDKPALELRTGTGTLAE